MTLKIYTFKPITKKDLTLTTTVWLYRNIDCCCCTYKDSNDSRNRRTELS